MRTIERRIGLLFAGFLLCFSLIFGRAFWLQGVQGAQLASEASYQQTEVVTVPGLRGSVLDRHGNALAVSEDAATIFATPYQVKKPALAADKLARDPRRGQRRGARAASPRTRASPTSPRRSTCRRAARIERLELPGIGELPDSRRTYPQGTLAAQVIGAVGAENQGLTGLEGGEDEVLGGTDGERRDRQGRARRADPAGNGRARPSDGEDIQLTLDPAIQAKTEEVLAEVGETYAPKGATAIVMDPRSSEVLAMANWPPVDPERPLRAPSSEDLINRATGFTYEPGSTFKAFTVAAALEEKEVTPGDRLHPAADDPGRRPRDRGVPRRGDR